MRLNRGLFPMMVLALPLSAQRPPRDTTYWVVGQMVDAKTGVPVKRGEICLGQVSTRRWNGMCDESDTAGVFRIEAEDPERVRLFFGCSPARGRYLVEMGSTIVAPSMDSAGPLRQHRVKAGRCDQRPYEVLRREFSGLYIFGFEAGSFYACGDTVGAWVDFTAVPGLKDVPLPYHSGGVSSAFVRWHGTRVGPGSYGHMGGEPYSLQVDSLFEARLPARDDCGTVSVDSLDWSEAVAKAIWARLRRGYRHTRFIFDTAGPVDSIDPWTKQVMAELGVLQLEDPSRVRDSVRVEFTNAAPLRFDEGPVVPLLELGFWVYPVEIGANGPPAFTCQEGTTVQLVRIGGALRVRFGTGGSRWLACGAISN